MHLTDSGYPTIQTYLIFLIFTFVCAFDCWGQTTDHRKVNLFCMDISHEYLVWTSSAEESNLARPVCPFCYLWWHIGQHRSSQGQTDHPLRGTGAHSRVDAGTTQKVLLHLLQKMPRSAASGNPASLRCFSKEVTSIMNDPSAGFSIGRNADRRPVDNYEIK